MVSPLRSDVGDLEAPTTYVEDVDGRPSGPMGGGEFSVPPMVRRCVVTCHGGPREAIPEIREHPPSMSKTMMAGSLGGDVGDLGAPTTYLEDVDGSPPGRRCQRSWSVHHMSQRR
jgi:hypothetical protein